MIRKELKEKYNIIGENSDISLYRKPGEYHYGVGYCGNITLKNGKAIFQEKSYSTIADLDNALRDWEKSLPYPVDTYNPMMNEGYKIYSQIIFYLTHKLGFKVNNSDWHQSYIKEIGPSFRLQFSIKQNYDENNVTITSSFGGMTLMQKVNDTQTGIEIISSIVNCEALQMAKDLIDTISICDEKVNKDIDAYVKDNSNIFGYRKVNFKDVMIEKLENILKQLKGE